MFVPQTARFYHPLTGAGRRNLCPEIPVNHLLTTLDPSNRVLKRAQYEAFTFSLLESDVLVRNESHLRPEEHEYRVTVDAGVPVACECPADERYDGPCKHRVAVAIRRPILDFVRDVHLATDGGPEGRRAVDVDEETRTETHEETARDADEDSADDGTDCDCHLLDDDFPCWECVKEGRRQLPEA